MATWLFRKILFRVTFFLALLWLPVLSSGLLAADMAGSGQGCPQDSSGGQSPLSGAGDCRQNEQNADNLTPEQRSAIQREISRNGGLTPEAIEALRQDPEFRDVDVDEILRGRELQQMKDGGQGGYGPVDHNAEGSHGGPYDGYDSGYEGRRYGGTGYGGRSYDGSSFDGRGYDNGAYGRFGRVNGRETPGADEPGDYSGTAYDGNWDNGDGYGGYNEGGQGSNAYGTGPVRDDYSGRNVGIPGTGRYSGYGNNGVSGYLPGRGGDGNFYGNYVNAGNRPGRGPGGNYYWTGGNNNGYYDTGRQDAGPYHLSYGPDRKRPAPVPGPYKLESDEQRLEDRTGINDEWAERERRGTGLPLPEKVSLFDRYIKNAPLEVGRLKPFGYELFKGVLLRQPGDLPVASDYAVGPGDEINIFLWGRVNARYTLTVNRDCTILFPTSARSR